MHIAGLLEWLAAVKVAAVEVCGTVVFIVFVVVESVRAIQHLLRMKGAPLD